MAKELASIDISKSPDVLRIAEEVRATNIPRILRRDNEDIAVVMPIHPRRRVGHHDPHRAFLSAAGGWKNLVDADALKRDLKASRGSDRASVEL